MKKLYTAVMTASGGRSGIVKSPDGKYEYALSMPKELRGEGGDGVNPELLFAAGYSACFRRFTPSPKLSLAAKHLERQPHSRPGNRSRSLKPRSARCW